MSVHHHDLSSPLESCVPQLIGFNSFLGLLANEINNESTLASNFAHLTSPSNNSNNSVENCNGTDVVNNTGGNYNGTASRLHFHERTGSLVKLSNNCRTAERRRPFDEFNNGVVMTHRPLFDDELFEVIILLFLLSTPHLGVVFSEMSTRVNCLSRLTHWSQLLQIRIDRLVDKWSGSIEVGITTHNPALLQFPATMTNMRSGNYIHQEPLNEGRGFKTQTMVL